MANLEGAYADPEKLHEFAESLTRFAERIADLDQELQRELARLGQTFRDEEYEKFRVEFVNSRKRLNEFVDNVRVVVPRLHQDAEHVAASQRVTLDPGA